MGNKLTSENCLANKFPAIAKQWHPTKNGELKPTDVSCFSNKKVWWIGKCGHEWDTEISRRSSGSSCPYCCGRRVCEENCLATKYPTIAAQWHPTKNGTLTPQDVTVGSNKRMWWICEKGHEWIVSINNRIKYKTGCPYCSNQKVCKDNCLETTHPKIASQWHKNKNGNLTPLNITAGSNKKVYWICECGHEWDAVVSNRTKLNTGCPYCSNKKTCIDNCLQTTHPEIATQWHPTKNVDSTPYDVCYGSDKKAWWICKEGHEWDTEISHRTTGHTNCPYCSGKNFSPDMSLSARLQEIAKQWHPTKNGELKPTDVSFRSYKTAWWICNKGHEYQSRISDRLRGNGCPYCSGRLPLKDTCLATKNPKLSLEWDYDKNGKLDPHSICANSNKQVYWKCLRNELHTWKASISNRNNKNSGCPYCHGILMKDGTLCSSLPEAIKYIEYKKMGLEFQYNKEYNEHFGKFRYDFYFPKENKYVEVTSYTKNSLKTHTGRYFGYLRKIVKKKQFVENVLKSTFEFIQFSPTREQIKNVKKWTM